MEESLKEIQAADQLKQSLQELTTTQTSDEYGHIKLTEEEEKAWTAWGLLKGRKRKAAILNEIAYARKINTSVEYPKMDYDQLSKFILKKNPEFIIDSDNEVIFELLCQYFSGDPGFELSGQFSFSKGIMLKGPVGCGKTSLMKMFSVNTYRPFCVTPCIEMADAYQVEGAESLRKYSTMLPVIAQLNYGFDLVGHCYDDLGTEDDKKNFGNQVNVMQNLLYKTYDHRMMGNIHMTTNLGGDQIEAFYGKRIRDRLREMFNVLKFSPDTKTRRK